MPALTTNAKSWNQSIVAVSNSNYEINLHANHWFIHFLYASSQKRDSAKPQAISLKSKKSQSNLWLVRSWNKHICNSVNYSSNNAPFHMSVEESPKLLGKLWIWEIGWIFEPESDYYGWSHDISLCSSSVMFHYQLVCTYPLCNYLWPKCWCDKSTRCPSIALELTTNCLFQSVRIPHRSMRSLGLKYSRNVQKWHDSRTKSTHKPRFPDWKVPKKHKKVSILTLYYCPTDSFSSVSSRWTRGCSAR